MDASFAGPNAGDVLHFLGSVYELTVAAGVALDREDWEEVFSVLDHRARLFEAHGAAFERYASGSSGDSGAPVLDPVYAEIRAAAERLQSRHFELVARLERYHAETAQELGRVEHGSRAAHAYRSPEASPAIDLQG